jgi:hypothetical protein
MARRDCGDDGALRGISPLCGLIEVFDGNTGDPKTLAAQVRKLKQRFGLDHVVLVGDRGMITQARLTEDVKTAGLDWITALRAPAITELVKGGVLQLSLFDQRDMASITSPDFPGERLIVCRNPNLAAERTRKRQDLLAATERDLTRIQAAVARQRNPLRSATEIALAVGAVIEKHKMRKHFDMDITDTTFTFTRKVDTIAAEAANDGIYIIRTSLAAEVLDDAATVRSYKSLSQVERAFRCIKTVALHVRPVHHWLAGRVRAHVFLCMLAYYLEWHMRQKLAPLLFDDADKEAAEALRNSVVARARRRAAAPLHVAGGDVVEHHRAILQVPFGERRLDGGLTFAKPVERGVEVVLVNLAQTEDRAQAGGGGGGCECPRGGQFRAGIDDTRGDHGQDEVAATVAGGSDDAVEADFPRGAEDQGGMAMRQRAGDGEGFTIGGDNRTAFEYAAQTLDVGRRPIGEIAERALTDLTVLAVALAQQDGRWRVPIGDGFDIHGGTKA